jgi:hypothetical protein
VHLQRVAKRCGIALRAARETLVLGLAPQPPLCSRFARFATLLLLLSAFEAHDTHSNSRPRASRAARNAIPHRFATRCKRECRLQTCSSHRTRPGLDCSAGSTCDASESGADPVRVSMPDDTQEILFQLSGMILTRQSQARRLRRLDARNKRRPYMAQIARRCTQVHLESGVDHEVAARIGVQTLVTWRSVVLQTSRAPSEDAMENTVGLFGALVVVSGLDVSQHQYFSASTLAGVRLTSINVVSERSLSELRRLNMSPRGRHDACTSKEGTARATVARYCDIKIATISPHRRTGHTVRRP